MRFKIQAVYLITNKAMQNQANDAVDFNLTLIQKYNLSGPRYTSYPTAVVFDPTFDETAYRKNLMAYYDYSQCKPLSLYFHIPFCDTLCFFCACNKIATKKREKADIYLDYLEQEIKMQAALVPADRAVEQMHFGGGTPTFLTHPQLKRMMAMINKHFKLIADDRRDYSIEIDPREAAPDTIQLLADLGFNRFSMGVQDVQEKVQRAVNRIQPIELTAEAIDRCRANGAKSINIDLIYGLPHQTYESFKDTLAQVTQLSPDRLSVFNYAHMPHLFKPQKRILATDLPTADEKLSILQMTIEELTAAGYVYIGMDHFAKPDDELAIAQKNGHLQRNFQGYTTHAECDLLSMGVSAISLINNSFSQNVKTLTAYYQQIDQGHIPIAKGYALNQDDLIRKQVIQSLSCHFQVNKTQIGSQFEIDFDRYFSDEMNQLTDAVNDGLINIKKDSIEVTPSGRLLIRNLCMTFDAHLQQQTQQKFSKVI